MEFKMLIDYSKQAPKPKRDWLAIGVYAAMAALVVALYFGLQMRGVL
jgi:hypothetical protein